MSLEWSRDDEVGASAVVGLACGVALLAMFQPGCKRRRLLPEHFGHVRMQCGQGGHGRGDLQVLFSKARIDRLALKRQDAEDAFVNAPQRLPLDEATYPR
jgi:hypothetical protein